MNTITPKHFLFRDLYIANVFHLPHNQFWQKRGNNRVHAGLRVWQRGDFLIQSWSSCVPAAVLNPAQGEKVLDCCAAPGNKTTHLAVIFMLKLM